MLVPLVAIAQTAPPAQPFQRLDGCVYKSQRWNDGDSFHVLLRDQKEVVFRLYFVDTPEEERVYADRVAEQAAYFGISADAALEVGKEASEFTKRALAKPFTDLHTLAAGARTQRNLALLRNRCHGRRSRPERAACEQWASANLWDTNAVAGWSRFAVIPGASA
jgi:hypothetical protein